MPTKRILFISEKSAKQFPCITEQWLAPNDWNKNNNEVVLIPNEEGRLPKDVANALQCLGITTLPAIVIQTKGLENNLDMIATLANYTPDGADIVSVESKIGDKK